MKPCVAILVLVAVSSIASSTAFAQRLGRIGRPGRFVPNTWRYNGPVVGPRRVYPSYYPNYSSSYYYTYPNYSYATPSYPGPVYASPVYPAPGVNASSGSQGSAPPVAANSVPIPSISPPGAGETFTLTNPRGNGGTIRYTLNNFSYTMNPGESQTVPLDRDWEITFDSGLNKTLRYRMEPGRYEFTVSPETGWNVVRHVPPVAVPPSEASPSDVNPALAEPVPL
jgi:hypothetical protein